MRTFKLELLSILAVFIGLLPGHGVRADEVQPLDVRQVEIANSVADKLIERIKALKPQFPELKNFGKAPYFTRGDGEFRYDYKTEKVAVNNSSRTQAKPGGCGIYFRLYAVGTPATPWSDLYYGWASGGGDRAGITMEMAVTVYQKTDGDETNAALNKAITDAEQQEMDTTFARLTSEYALSKKGFGLDVPSLLAALETHDSDNRFDNVSLNAITALRFCKLTQTQLAQIKQGFHDGKYPLGDARVAMQIIDEQEHASLPAFMDDLIAVSLAAEQAGSDTFKKTPFFDQPWQSDARNVRLGILSFFKDGNPIYLEPAGRILADDTDLNNRLQALNYISKQRGPDVQKLLVGALQNSFRSVQAEAAKDCAQKKITVAVDGLRLQLKSSSANVRGTAAAALKQLGQTVPESVPVPPLPDSARYIASGMWAYGLMDDDFLVLHALPWPNKAQMSSLDADSIKKVANIYAVQKLDRTVPWIHTTPPAIFILAAALKFNDIDSANLVYGRMCDVYETDEAALYDGLNNLGWDRFSVALDQFHHHNDAAAITASNEVLKLSDAAKPFTLLSMYVKQSNELLQYLKTKPPDKVVPEPDKSDTAAYINYWIAQFKDCDGETPSDAGMKIREIGLPALPMLIDALNDKTPTRNFSYGRSYLPQRDFIYVGGAAKNVIIAICKDYGLSPMDEPSLFNTKPADLKEKLRAWFKTVTMDTKRLPPPGTRDLYAQYPAGRYYWGDD